MPDRKINFCSICHNNSSVLLMEMLTLQKYKISPYIIWYICGPHSGENETKSYGKKLTKFWAFWQKKNQVSWKHFLTKCWRHFAKRFCSWNSCVMWYIDFQPTIFQCSKNYGSPTRVTRSKVAPNMTDPTIMKSLLSSLKTEYYFFNKSRQHHAWNGEQIGINVRNKTLSDVFKTVCDMFIF